MKVSELTQLWEDTAGGQITNSSYAFRLPIDDAAKLEALAEMYPRRSVEHLLGDLVSAALDDLEQNMPYIKGNKVITQDEMGDPVYEDIGLTPRFLTLIKKHLKILKNEKAVSSVNQRSGAKNNKQ